MSRLILLAPTIFSGTALFSPYPLYLHMHKYRHKKKHSEGSIHILIRIYSST